MVAIRHGGQLSATTYAIDDRVFLEVRDTGIGIPQDLDIHYDIQNNKIK